MSKIRLINASCVDQEVDAVVNAANRNLWSGAGVCGEIFEKAGYQELKNECEKINTPLKDGDAIITSSCKMDNCKFIIHAVGPDFSYTPGAFEELYNAYYNSLLVLKKNNLHSISFPLISSGIFGYGLDNPSLESSKACIRAYEIFTKDNSNYEIDVLLCAYTYEEMQEANKEYELYNFIKAQVVNPIELSNKLIDEIYYDDIIVITISESGAMGRPNSFFAVDKNLNLYHTIFGNKMVDFNQLQQKFALLKNFRCSCEHVDYLENNWSWFNMGFGNYLMVRNEYYTMVENYIKENLSVTYEHGELYRRWYFILKKLYQNKKL